MISNEDDADSLLVANYPGLWHVLREESGKQVAELSSGGVVRLEANRAAYAPDSTHTEVEKVTGKTQRIAPDGMLNFTVELSKPLYVMGTLELESEADLRPGLRASVLCDTRLIGAPMVSAPLWGADDVTVPAPFVVGSEPSKTIPLNTFLLPRGRHHLTVAGPHFRAGGIFHALTLRALEQPVETPLVTFAFISDTHIRYKGRSEWMNIKMGGAGAKAFLETLHSLAEEKIDFVLHGGDMTEGATHEEFALFAGLLRNQPLPLYGCIGNHDAYHPTSRSDALELLSNCFPGGSLDYSFMRPPVRFLVLDENIARPEKREAKQDWLRKTLKADTQTPTILLWHYAPYNRAGESSCGFRVPDWSKAGKESVLDIVRETPNLFATLNGHDHWDEVNRLEGITHIQNAAFIEWPNSYRVIRVYADRIEWEVRQVANRGFIRESFAVPKALSWMIATRESDLTGTAKFRQPKRSFDWRNCIAIENRGAATRRPE